MKRTNADGFEADKNGAGRNGFTDAEPNPTTIEETWLNSVQEEIARAIELRGVSLNPANMEQLGTIVEKLIEMVGSTSVDNEVPRFHTTTGRIVQQSGMRISDAIEVEYVTPKTRYLRFSAAGFVPSSGTPTSSTNTPGTKVLTSNAGTHMREFALPVGATIIAVRFALDPGVARSGTDRMSVALVKRPLPAAISPWPDAWPSSVSIASERDNATSLPQTVTLSGLSEVVDDSLYWVAVTSGNDAGTNNDLLYAVEVEYTDPGPKNLG